jgi:diguanylate cyclase (GGDEF)-like protein
MALISMAQLAVAGTPADLTVTMSRTLGYVAAAVVLLGVLILVVRVEWLRRRCSTLTALAESRAAELEEAQGVITKQRSQLAELARTDSETGLGTRRALAEDLPGRLGLARRGAIADWPDHFCPRNGLALFLIEIDHFDEVAKRNGKPVAALLLQEVASALHQMVRTGDILVRWSDHELLVLASSINHEGVPLMAEKLMRAVATAKVTTESGREIGATASMGFCPYPLIKRENITPANWSQLVELVEKYLARARSRGGSRACGLNWAPTYSPEHGEVEVLARLIANPELKLEGLELQEITFKL